jgi:catechol 2,3-dioxygenase-like lactoylglutathione lyase family enzyme
MLKSIAIVTIAVTRLSGIESAYENYLGYDTVERGAVSADLAELWGAPASSGKPYLLMQPESGQPVYLRFIEGPPVEGYAPMTTLGWNATEILVKDPDAIAARLEDSPFEIIGPPKDLWDAPDAPRAAQAIGPGNELLYLTRNNNFEILTDVDRVFIMVLAGASMPAMQNFYGGVFGLEVGDATPFQISVVSQAQGLPAETAYPLAVARVSSSFLIELDEYTPASPARPVDPGSLPPGISMVSFEVDDLDRFNVKWRGQPRAVAVMPYGGREAAVLSGPAGEWIELIEMSVE